MYAIIDIETTGGSPVNDKITEIAVFIYDGEKIVDEFVSLINPERQIPYHITQLTGISNAMVADAPKFYELARKIIEITDSMIFVAHNVSFDYGFVCQEFKNLGYEYHRDRLCTVQLSRKIIPGHRSYSLGKLCYDLNIAIAGRHRAAGDAMATVELFKLLQQKNNDQIELSTLAGIVKKDLHPSFDPTQLKALPESAGVYYFYNEHNDLIYIGKSNNIRSRILSHFRNVSTKKAFDMRNEISTLDYDLTGCELVALLRESHEIKQNKPKHNRAQRRSISGYALYTFTDEAGYIRFEISKHSLDRTGVLHSFSSKMSGSMYLQRLVDSKELCQKLCGLYQTMGSCFHYEIGCCRGACIGIESAENYNRRASEVIEMHRFRHNSFFIIDKGRTEQELAAVMVEKGKYKGFGYLDRQEYEKDPSLLPDCIHSYSDNSDIQQILRHYLREGTPEDIITFSNTFF